MSYDSERIEANRERIKSLPTMTLANGTVMPAHSVRGEDRDMWYMMKDAEKAAAKAAVKRHVDSLKPDRSAVQAKLDYINEKILDERLAKMTPRERMYFLEKRKLEAQLKKEDEHAKAAENPKVTRALAVIEKLLSENSGEQSVSLAATAEAIRENPGDIDLLLGHLRTVVGELDQSKKAAFNEAAAKLSSIQSQAIADHAKEQAAYARHEASLLETNHELDQLGGSADGAE